MLVSGLVATDKYSVNMSSVLFWPAVYFLFYYFSRSGLSNRVVLFLILLLFIEVGIFYLIINQDKNLNVLNKIASVNHIYYILLLLPWLFLVKNKLVINIILFLVVIMTINSAKRGAMLAVLASGGFYIYFSYFKGALRSKSFLLTYILGFIFVVVGYMVFDYYNEKSGGYILNRFENIEEDQGSGRLEIYSEVWRLIFDSPAENILMGHGHNEVFNNTSFHLSSHNDYLEVFYDYGIIGLTLLIFLLIILLKRTIRLFRKNSEYKIAYLSAFIIFLLMTSISHLILYPTYIIYLAAFLGYIETDVNRQLTSNRKVNFI